MVDISYVIVNWNTRDMVKNCIISLIKEAGQRSWEILVVDNGSTDGSQNIIQEFGDDVRLIENGENLGFAKAVNIGIGEAKGKWICLVNSDIMVLDHCGDRLIDFLQNNRDVGLVGPQTYNEDMSLRYNCRYIPTLWNAFCEAFFLDKIFRNMGPFRARLITHLSSSEPTTVEVLSGCFLATSKEIIDRIGSLDDRFFIYGEDTDWAIRMKKAGFKSVIYPLAKAIHVGAASSSTDPTRFLKLMLKSDLIFFKKHNTGISYCIYAVIKVMHHLVRLLGATVLSSITIFSDRVWTTRAKESWGCLLVLLNREG